MLNKFPPISKMSTLETEL